MKQSVNNTAELAFEICVNISFYIISSSTTYT